MRNDISGLGLNQFDSSEEFGSAGRLQSAIFINFRMQGPLIHEIAHNWAAFLRSFGGTFWNGHWGMSDVQGVLGGYATSIESVGDGEYAVLGNAASSHWNGIYSKLELYLMGLVPALEVGSHRLLVDPSGLHFDEDGNAVVTASLDTVTVYDIIESDGLRLPGVEKSQKAFKMATVVVSDQPLSPVELTYYEMQAEWFGSDRDSNSAFAEATGYRATMDTRLEPSITAVLVGAGAADRASPSVPELAHNYPNPFNASTTLAYRLPYASDPSAASIEIFAANGQRVREMVVQGTQSGVEQVVWDGKDDRGLLLATEVYVAVLRAADAIAARKVTLLK